MDNRDEPVSFQIIHTRVSGAGVFFLVGIGFAAFPATAAMESKILRFNLQFGCIFTANGQPKSAVAG